MDGDCINEPEVHNRASPYLHGLTACKEKVAYHTFGVHAVKGLRPDMYIILIDSG